MATGEQDRTDRAPRESPVAVRRPGPLLLFHGRPLTALVLGWLLARIALAPLRTVGAGPFVLLPGFLLILWFTIHRAGDWAAGMDHPTRNLFVTGVAADSLPFWILRQPGRISPPWRLEAVLLSLAFVVLLAASWTALRRIGCRIPRRRRAPRSRGRGLALVGAALFAILAFRATFLLSRDLPNEARSLFLGGHEVHHAVTAGLLLLLLVQGVSSRCLSTGPVATIGYGLLAGGVLDQATYLPLTEITDAAYGGTVSWIGAFAGLVLLGLHVRRATRSGSSATAPDPGRRGKLLAHRLRGFDTIEHTPAALRAALESTTPWLEMDTRTTADGRVFVYHNPRFGPETTARGLFHLRSAAEVSGIRYLDGQPLLSLETALDLFREGGSPGQRLCLDLKDCGSEEEHLRRVRDRGLEERICWVSWSPATLLRLRELGATSPLILSHMNLTRLGRAGSWIARRAAGLERRIGQLALIGVERFEHMDQSLWRGLQHALLATVLPESLRAPLAESGGGICVPRYLAGRRLEEYCRSADLALWVFCVRHPGEFARWAARDGVDVVFSDDAPAASLLP